MTDRVYSLWAVLSVCLGLTLPAAGAKLSLPLEGYFRPGRYMPVAFLDGNSQTLTLAANGGMTTVIDSATDGIAPWLPLKDDLKSDLFTQSFHALGENDRLIGSVGDEIPPGLFPGCSMIQLHLNSADPLPGPPAAWQTFDAVVLDRAPPDAEIPVLLAGGTDIAVRAATAPDSIWPWRHDGAWWILDAPWRFAAVPSDSAYDVVAGWQPTQEEGLRQRWLLIGVIVAILLMSLRLWKSRMAPYAALLLAAVVTTGLLILPRQNRAWTSAQVRIEGECGAQDDWAFVRAIQPAAAFIKWSNDALLVPVLPEHASTQTVLETNGQGEPEKITYCLAENQTLAFVSKQVVAEKSATNLSPNIDSPARLIVNAAYPGAKIIGQTQANTDLGQAVWITKR